MTQHQVTSKHRYTRIVKVLLKNRNVTQPTRKRGFGSSGLYIRGKLFAFLAYRNRLILKLPQERVNKLIAVHGGARWHPCGDGRGMNELVVLGPSSGRKWLPLAKEAKEFVASAKNRKQ